MSDKIITFFNDAENWKHPVLINGMSEWNWFVQNPEKLSIGIGTDIGAFTYINAKHGVAIGTYVKIGSHCSIYSISTIDNKKGLVQICDNAKIGSHSVIMPNVTIGANAVVGAFSFVNKSIPADSMSYGIPAKIKKKVRKNDV